LVRSRARAETPTRRCVNRCGGSRSHRPSWPHAAATTSASISSSQRIERLALRVVVEAGHAHDGRLAGLRWLEAILNEVLPRTHTDERAYLRGIGKELASLTEAAFATVI
jgi:hypothetical protein